MKGEALIPETKKEILEYKNQDLSHIPERDPEALIKNNIVLGTITVIYDDSVAMFLDTNSQQFKNSNSQTKEVDNILEKYKVLSKYDLAQGMSEEEIRADQARMAAAFEGDIPDRRSIHTYNLPKEADLIKLLKELRALPFVRAAEPVYTTELSYTKTQLSSINASTTGTPPTDPVFGSGTPTANWWYFKRHQVFKGLQEFGTITTAKTPVIAVIDQSFDTNAAAIDKPNYLTGKRFLSCSGVNVGCITGGDVTPDVGTTSSHGTNVATVLAAPNNNGQGASGFAPFAKVLPYKVTLTSGIPATDYSIATAIRDAASNAEVDAINLSVASESNTCPKPISSSVVRTEVASAYAAGKVVVFAAGNAGVDVHGPNRSPSTSNCSALGDGGAIIVGGLADDTSVTPSRTMAWSSTNFDTTTTKIDIAAAAQNIYASEYDRSTNSRSFGNSNSGTSLAAPMVAATAAMMKRLYKSVNPGFTLSASDVQAILLASADVSRFSNSSSTAPETQFIGRQLADRSDNDGHQMVGARVLNMHNAMVMTKYLKQHQALVRLHNSDNKSQSTVNSVWCQRQC